MTIIDAGLLSTVQDLGREGYQSMGFSVSGALDRRSLILGNLLVGNPRSAAGIEMTLKGITAEFTSPAVIALTGADMKATINGSPFPRYRARYVHAGDVLKCGMAVEGCRGYLCIAGGVDVPEIMGSRSTNLKCKMGGFEGRKLAAGDWIAYAAASANTDGRRLAMQHFDSAVTVRVVMGPQDDLFTDEGIRAFLTSEYTVTPASDRMGARLEGAVVTAKGKSDIVSDGIAAGSVQIPSSGKPIILMADRQTTGGYAKAATVISVDLPKLAQLKPGDKVRFKAVSKCAARFAYIREEGFYHDLERGYSWKVY